MTAQNRLLGLLAILLAGSSGCASTPPQRSAVLAHEPIRQSAAPVTPPPAAQATLPHYAGEKLAETDLYQLFGKAGRRWCIPDREGNYAYVSLVFKVNPGYVVKSDPEYKRRFETEMLPIVREHCHPLGKISIGNYIFGFRISDNYDDYAYDQAMPGREIPLSEVLAYYDTHGDRGELHYASDALFSSLADLRKKHAESQASRARDKEEQEARAQEIKRAEKAERRRQQEPESKGGVEPTGDELATAYVRYPRFLACPHFEDMEWCNVAPPARIWVRFKGGNKHGCEAVVEGADYHCRFRVEYDCLVQGSGDKAAPDIITFPLCYEFRNPPEHATGVRRTSNGWELYPLE